jgi:transposase-like protein/IS1 family transposase
MTCHNCKTKCSRFGIQNGFQRYQCKQCKRTFSDIPVKPLDNLRLPFEKAVQVVHLLCEGVGIRAIERLAGVNRNTVLNVLETVGQKCARLLDQRVRNVAFLNVQVDELFAFVGCKEKNNETKDTERGDQYVFMGVDADSKFIINFAIGKRDVVTTQIYCQDLKKRVQTPFQITTDGFTPYGKEVYYTFQQGAHFAQLVKQYANSDDATKNFERRYSPSICTGIRKTVRIGNPDRDLISTSYVERTNLSFRIFNRRFTRLTLGYSKKLVNLKHSVALFIAHFNFCRKHSTIAQTPAQACRLADHQWTITELLNES